MSHPLTYTIPPFPASSSASSHKPLAPPLCQSRGGEMLKPGVTFCKERESEKVQIAQRWGSVLGKEPWLGGRAGTALGPGLRNYVLKDWQLIIHSFPWEALGCFPGKGTVCRRDSSRRQVAHPLWGGEFRLPVP